ncbi:MAG: winged helix-turn-helix domain-containing protein [Rubrivivax sp.]
MPIDDTDRCMALVLADDAQARQPLERAWQAARERDDAAAQHVLAAAALLAIELEMADFRGLHGWLARFADGEAAAPPPRRPLDALRLDAARLVLPALDHRFAYGSATAREAAARLLQALRAGAWPAGDEHALLAKVLHEYHGMEYEAAACERVAALAAPGLPQASPGWQARWWVQLEDCLGFWGHAEAAAQARQRLAVLAAEPAAESDAALPAWSHAVVELRHALRGSDAAAQDRAYAAVDRLRTLQRPGRALQGLRWQAMVLLQRGRFRAALEKAELLLDLSADVEVPERDRGVYHDLRAQALAGVGRWDEALQVLDGLRGHQTGAQGRIVLALQAAMRAAQALAQGAADAPALCLQALRAAAANDWPRFLGYFPDWAAQVADAGLQAGVEVEFASVAIRERRLVPTPRWRDDWPWRLKVRVLGALAIERDGRPLVIGGKTPRKPLELLALLAAHGGRPLDAQTVIDDLWPSLDASTPRASLDMAVSRLRKLLDLPDAVVLADGRLSLHPALTWTDVAAFEQLADEAEAGVPGAAERALRLHADRLLGSEALAGLSARRRRQLLQRQGTLALDHARTLLDAGDAASACHVLQRSLRCDPGAAPLAQALAQAQLHLAGQLRPAGELRPS